LKRGASLHTVYLGQTLLEHAKRHSGCLDKVLDIADRVGPLTRAAFEARIVARAEVADAIYASWSVSWTEYKKNPLPIELVKLINTYVGDFPFAPKS
jgi:hypothetical protein